MSLNIASPNYVRAPLPKTPPAPSPLVMAEANSQLLLDEMAIAAQMQLLIGCSALRKEWRSRMNDCRAELGKRMAPDAKN